MQNFQEQYGITNGTAMEIVEIFKKFLLNHNVVMSSDERSKLIESVYELLVNYIDE